MDISVAVNPQWIYNAFIRLIDQYFTGKGGTSPDLIN